ncbi:hypothetical protein [Bacillus sp. P14.5]|uniref:hypothetical protein n=1 Tax=Bacillus sp. P14.5 TaxID=1983400 RepID=UPI000DE83707|nr:hypothetical protein [Bacillus sp. P14.5]
MNITLFYKKISLHYFKRATATLLLAVLLSLLIPGLHILFYFIMLLTGIFFIFMYLIYDREVGRSMAALQTPANGKSGSLVVTKKDKSYSFFGFDGIMKGSASCTNSRWIVKMNDHQAAMKRGNDIVALDRLVDYRKLDRTYAGWKDSRGNTAAISRRGEGWILTVNEKKVCSIIRGRMPAEIQKLFDPSSIILHFEEVDDVDKVRCILFVVLFMEDYYII